MKFCIIGLGRFGYNLAIFLSEHGHEVLAVDKNDSAVSAIKDYVTQAVCANVTDAETLLQIGIEDIQTVIVAIGEDFAQSTLITALLKKEIQTPVVIARAMNQIHETVLKLVGADQVLLLEKEIAFKLAEKLNMPIGDMIQVSDNFATLKLQMNKRFVGKTIKQIIHTKNNKITALAVQKGDEMILITSDYIVMENDVILFAGNKRSLSLLIEL